MCPGLIALALVLVDVLFVLGALCVAVPPVPFCVDSSDPTAARRSGILMLVVGGAVLLCLASYGLFAVVCARRWRAETSPLVGSPLVGYP